MALKSKQADKVRKGVPTDDVTKEDLVRVNMKVPKSLRAAMKHVSEDVEMSLTDLIMDAVESKYGEAIKAYRRRQPVSA